QPVEQGGADVADVEQAGGAGREADAGGHRASAALAERVGDRVAPVAAEIAAGDLDAGCRLAALVFGDVEQVLDPLDSRPVVAALDDLGHRLLAFDQPAQDV